MANIRSNSNTSTHPQTFEEAISVQSQSQFLKVLTLHAGTNKIDKTIIITITKFLKVLTSHARTE